MSMVKETSWAPPLTSTLMLVPDMVPLTVAFLVPFDPASQYWTIWEIS